LLLGKEKVQFQPRPGKQIHVVISRGLMRHETFAFPATLPPQQLKKALVLAIQRWTPFKSAGSAAIWSGHRATVYAWDAERLATMVTGGGYDPARCKFIPEPFYRAPGSNETRLIACIDGIEGQIWRGGFLLTSRWWGTTPQLQDWIAFLRSVRDIGDTQNAARPTEVTLPLLDAPWTSGMATLDNALELFDTPRSRAWLAAAAAALPIFLATQWMAVVFAGAGLDAEQARLMVTSSSARAERDSMIANLDAIDRLLLLDRRPTQFEILARVGIVLADTPVKIVDWTFDIEALEISLESQTELEATRYIEMFEGDPMFESVSKRSVPQPLILRLRMDLAQTTEPRT